MATQRHQKFAGETLIAGVNFTDRLTDGDTLTGTPTAVVSPSGPTIGTVSKNASIVTILLESVAINCAALFSVAGGTAGITYTITVTAATTSGQTLIETCTLSVL